jgi:hypothetical protein
MTAVCSTATHLLSKKLLGGSVSVGRKVGFMDIVLLWEEKTILGHREVKEAWWDWELRCCLRLGWLRGLYERILFLDGTLSGNLRREKNWWCGKQEDSRSRF